MATFNFPPPPPPSSSRTTARASYRSAATARQRNEKSDTKLIFPGVVWRQTAARGRHEFVRDFELWSAAASTTESCRNSRRSSVQLLRPGVKFYRKTAAESVCGGRRAEKWKKKKRWWWHLKFLVWSFYDFLRDGERISFFVTFMGTKGRIYSPPTSS